jgi:hypothetical protein
VDGVRFTIFDPRAGLLLRDGLWGWQHKGVGSVRIGDLGFDGGVAHCESTPRPCIPPQQQPISLDCTRPTHTEAHHPSTHACTTFACTDRHHRNPRPLNAFSCTALHTHLHVLVQRPTNQPTNQPHAKAAALLVPDLSGR